MTYKIKRYVSALVFFIIGIIGGFIPILQGWVFIAIALLILKNDLPFVMHLMQRLKKRFPKVKPYFVVAEKRVDALMGKFGLVKEKNAPHK